MIYTIYFLSARDNLSLTGNIILLLSVFSNNHTESSLHYYLFGKIKSKFKVHDVIELELSSLKGEAKSR